MFLLHALGYVVASVAFVESEVGHELLEDKYNTIMLKLEIGDCLNSNCIVDEIYSYNSKIKASKIYNENFLIKGMFLDYSDLDLIDYSVITVENHKGHINYEALLKDQSRV